MNSAGSYVQESSRKQGPKGMKGKTRHVTSTPPSPTNTQTHASFVFRSRRSSGMLIQLAQLAKPGTKKTAVRAAEIIVFPTVLRSWRTPLHCPPRSHDWKDYFFLGVERFYFYSFFSYRSHGSFTEGHLDGTGPPSCVSSHCALSLR